ncbi:MAG: hypothetical protein AABW88_01405 [Nanoarchaeota archaeon]
MVTVLSQAIIDIYNTGFFDYFLPFMVSFALIYGLMQKTMILGKDKNNLNAIFAVVVSLIIMSFAAEVNYTTYLSKLVFIMVKIFMLMVVLGLLGYKQENHKHVPLVALILTGIIIITEFFDIASLKSMLSWRSEYIYGAIIICVFLFILWAIVKPSVEPERKPKPEVKTPQQVQPSQPQRRASAPAERQRIPASELEKQLGIEIDREQ